MAEKVVLITGASRGIGRAIAERLGRAGHRLGLFARDAQALEKIAAGLSGAGGAVRVLAGDVTVEADARSAVESLIGEYGRIDVLINNAGIGNFRRADQFSLAEFEEVQRVNLYGPFLFTKYVVPHMIERRAGQIVNMSSVAGLNGFKGGAAYAASKFALNGFTESLREDVKQYGIAVTALCPGSVATDFAGVDHSGRDYALEPDDVARTVEYLVNESETANAKLIELKPRRRESFRG